MPTGGEDTAGDSARGLLLSIDERGRGGAMVPKRMEASCLAPPWEGASSSSEDESSESTTDQSSSSWRPSLRAGGPEGSLKVGVTALLAFSCVRRWKGFVDTSLVLLGGGGGVEAALFSWLDKAIFFKNGFLVSVSPWPG